jgi:hypothetical protein
MKTSILAVALIGMAFTVSAKADGMDFTGNGRIELMAGIEGENIIAVEVRMCEYRFIRKHDLKSDGRFFPKGSVGFSRFPQKKSEPCKEHINNIFTEIPAWDKSEVMTAKIIKDEK